MTALLASAAVFYAEHNRRQVAQKESLQSIEQILAAQNSAVAGRVSTTLQRGERDALLVLQRWKKKGKLRSFLSDTSLTEPDLPKWIIVAGRRVRAAGVMGDALLEDALEAHLQGDAILNLYSSKNKYYLFIKGGVDGTDFAAAYDPEAFFSSFRSDQGTRLWLTLGDGTVIYHPLHRFIGSNASNLRPVAAGMKELASKRPHSFNGSYLGIEAKQTVGAWSSIPELSLLVGTEWPSRMDFTASSAGISWIGFLCLFLAGIFLGLAWKKSEEPKKERIFEENRLDDEAMEYLEQVRASAALAHDLAQQKEKETEIYAQLKGEAVAEKSAIAWKLSLLEDVLALPLAGRQVWADFARLWAERCPGVSVAYYRFSPSTYSLVPESVYSAESAGIQSFLRETRIYLGSESHLPKVVHTESFRQWKAKLPGSAQNFFQVIPVKAAEGNKGALLIFHHENLNRNGEINGSLSYFQDLAARIQGFCDSFGQLLQSSNAKGNSPHLAGAANQIRNQPRPS